MPVKPSDAEDEYFKKRDLERLREERARKTAEMAVEERERLRNLHWMRCPKCGLELSTVSYRGVDVDTCLSCGGMFLDRGEAEKIIAHREPGWFDQMFGSFLGRSEPD